MRSVRSAGGVREQPRPPRERGAVEEETPGADDVDSVVEHEARGEAAGDGGQGRGGAGEEVEGGEVGLGGFGGGGAAGAGEWVGGWRWGAGGKCAEGKGGGGEGAGAQGWMHDFFVPVDTFVRERCISPSIFVFVTNLRNARKINIERHHFPYTLDRPNNPPLKSFKTPSAPTTGFSPVHPSPSSWK